MKADWNILRTIRYFLFADVGDEVFNPPHFQVFCDLKYSMNTLTIIYNKSRSPEKLKTHFAGLSEIFLLSLVILRNAL